MNIKYSTYTFIILRVRKIWLLNIPHLEYASNIVPD